MSPDVFHARNIGVRHPTAPGCTHCAHLVEVTQRTDMMLWDVGAIYKSLSTPFRYPNKVTKAETPKSTHTPGHAARFYTEMKHLLSPARFARTKYLLWAERREDIT